MTRFLALATFLAGAATAFGHDLTVEARYDAEAALVRVSYDRDDPATEAEAYVWAPDSEDAPFLAGRTDRNGMLAFVPDQPGEWRIVVDDGMGHREVRDLEIASIGAAPALTAEGPGTWARALTGVSVIFGLTGIWLWRRSREGAPDGSAS